MEAQQTEPQSPPENESPAPAPEENACLLNPNVTNVTRDDGKTETNPRSRVDLILVWFAASVKKSAEATRNYVDDWKKTKPIPVEEEISDRTIANDPYPGDLWTVVTCFCFALLGISGLMLELGPGYFNNNSDLEDGEFDFELLQVFIVMLVFCLAFYGSEKLMETYKRRNVRWHGLFLVVIYDAFVLNCFPVVETLSSMFHWTLFSWSTAIVLTLIMRLARLYRKLKALRRQDVLQGDPKTDAEEMQSLARRRSSGLESMLYQVTCTFVLIAVSVCLYLASADVNPTTGYFLNVVLGCNVAFLAASSLRLYVACKQDWRTWALRQEQKREDEVWNDRV